MQTRVMWQSQHLHNSVSMFKISQKASNKQNVSKNKWGYIFYGSQTQFKIIWYSPLKPMSDIYSYKVSESDVIKAASYHPPLER